MSLLVEVRFAACSQTRSRIVRDGIDVWNDDGQIYRESFAPDAFVKRLKPATFQLQHDGEVVGEVGPIVSHGQWYLADCILEDLPIVRERVKPGARVSLQARALEFYENPDLRLRRVERAELDHIALIAPGERAGYLDGATKVTSIRQLATAKPHSTRQGWRAMLPPGWEYLATADDLDEPPEALIDGRRVSWVWNGSRFVRPASSRAA
jgi:hypothetical protein